MTNSPERDTRIAADLTDSAATAAAIRENLEESHYGEVLAGRGITTVALADNGDIVEHRPDGSSAVLTARRPRPRKARPASK